MGLDAISVSGNLENGIVWGWYNGSTQTDPTAYACIFPFIYRGDDTTQTVYNFLDFTISPLPNIANRYALNGRYNWVSDEGLATSAIGMFTASVHNLQTVASIEFNTGLTGVEYETVSQVNIYGIDVG
jgi:hypothetical protein